MGNADKLYIENSDFINFETLPLMNNLETIHLSHCHIDNFRGIPVNFKTLFIRDSIIASFEGINLDNVSRSPKNPRLILQNCTIHSLGGISRLSLQSILIAYFLYDDDGPQDNTLKLTEKGRHLFYDSLNPEIAATYNPLNLHKWVDNVHNLVFQKENRYSLQHREWDSNYEFYKDRWIYGYHLQNLLFIPERLDILHEYYRKNILELAQDYITDTKSLSSDQLERLIREVDPEIRKMLENNLPLDNAVLSQISTKFVFETPDGLNILK
nr:hypothetical protein DSAG12_03824 [Candidatus Prometheoarchaeum syntrophicum]